MSVDDGLQLSGVWISAAVRCAPPDNKPTLTERDACAPFLVRELDLLEPRVVVCLGAFGFAAALSSLRRATPPKIRSRVEVEVPGGPTLLCSYHPSQQNTFTGKLTEPMLDDVMRRRRCTREPPDGHGRTVRHGIPSLPHRRDHP